MRPPKQFARDATSVSLRWRRFRKHRDQGDGPVTSYLIYYALAQDGTGAEYRSTRPSDNRGTVPDLEPDTTYQFMVVPVHETGIVGLGSPTINVSTCGGESSKAK